LWARILRTAYELTEKTRKKEISLLKQTTAVSPTLKKQTKQPLNDKQQSTTLTSAYY
jgi:hypothetical protein